MVQKSNHTERNFKIRGLLTSGVVEKHCLNQANNSGYEKAVFKINLDKTGLENPLKWETCMLLNEKWSKPFNNCVFLNAMVTAEQWNFNTNDKYHIFELH